MKNIYCAYYTNSEAITAYMTKMLHLEDKNIVLEPSAGEGIFIESMLAENRDIEIEALDMNCEAVNVLKHKFGNRKEVTSIRETDTLFDGLLDIYGMSGGYYDRIIGNPPYGAWQDYRKRKELKKKYTGYYVKETYSLFLLRCLELLKNEGILSFIIPDTYLFLNMHESLRKTLLRNAEIQEILIFPSNFFPGLSFGYSNLSIITLKRTAEEQKALDNDIRVLKGFERVEELPGILSGHYPDRICINFLKQSEIIQNVNARFLLADSEEKVFFHSIGAILGDFADVVTGFYCGDNKRFIRARGRDVKGANNYEIIQENQITEKASLDGVTEQGKKFIPYIKGASDIRYIRKTDNWFVQWDTEAFQYYHSNKKARFQNAAFYFRTGIAVPMVKSSVIKATLIENRVFDQSIVGIFPKDQKLLYYMLALLNSDIVCRMIHILNPTANNSANYIKQIPFYIPSENDLRKVDHAVADMIQSIYKRDETKMNEIQHRLNKFFEERYIGTC